MFFDETNRPSTERAFSTVSLGAMRVVEVVAAVLSGVLIFAWPLIAFAAVFIFDSPIRGAGDEIARYTFFFALLVYPGWLAYVLYLRHVGRLPVGPWRRIALFGAPCLHVVTVFLFFGVIEALLSP